MKWKLISALALVAIAVTAVVGNVGATPANPPLFTGSTIARAQLPELDIKSQVDADVWKAMLKTKGVSDLYVQQNVFKPGATSGWHTHPGPSLITVTQGTVTVYDGDDPTCTPQVYSASSQGTGFVDIGGGAVPCHPKRGFGRRADDRRAADSGGRAPQDRRAQPEPRQLPVLTRLEER